MESKKILVWLSGLVLFFIVNGHAQNANDPGEYISTISKARGDMDAKYMAYISAAAHGRRARKVEKLRQQVLDNISECRSNTSGIPKYKGDGSLKQGSLDYITTCYRVFNEDYGKVVNMEELAEQSFDEMQAYILLNEKINEKLTEAENNLNKATRDFAAKYNVTLIEDKNPLGEKMEVAAKLTHYTNNIYLMYFKCNWQYDEAIKAMNNKKVNDVEQARNAVIRYANEGLQALDTTKPFDNDPTLINACRRALTYYKNIAEKDIPQLTDYFLKEEEFNKAKRNFETKSDRSKSEVDAYNKSVKDFNAAVNKFNQVNAKDNNDRKQVQKDWEDTEKHFQDDHMPYYK
ncbi:MAG: hypothetical protein JST75_06760 [Bacteroidetes bacterium]|nr:hypothetical protein [Bacteroidota bacterium]